MDWNKKMQEDLSCILPDINLDVSLSILNGNLTIDEYLITHKLHLETFDKNVLQNIIQKYQKLSNGQVLNHTYLKLSDLDMEMIQCVPEGGNWKDIPDEIKKKSKRLTNVALDGRRSTLYGRLQYSKPSYTISTYFNRPGNGTYIHPRFDRTITMREAARFQCFPDDYYFFGNKSQILKQIGNAVPSLMAYQIGKRASSLCKIGTSIDLFCGAGGLTYGFKQAGIKSILANDIELSACMTHKINNPEIPVLCGDIVIPNIKEQIINCAIKNHVDIICGGPPCQGFSVAGLRKEDDPRNHLFHEFVDIVAKVSPRVIVFENVKGILSFNSRQTYKEIMELFASLGYFAEGKILITSQFGVPQKRERVFIICTRRDLNINPLSIFPEPFTMQISQQTTVYQTISDLEQVPCEENAKYVDSAEESNVVKMLKHKISFEDYLETIPTYSESKRKMALVDSFMYEQLSF